MMTNLNFNKKASNSEFAIASSFLILILFLLITHYSNSSKKCVIDYKDNLYNINYSDIKLIGIEEITFETKENRLVTVSGDYKLECYN